MKLLLALLAFTAMAAALLFGPASPELRSVEAALREDAGGTAAGGSGTMERVSVASDGTEADGPSPFPSVSTNGRFVAFYSEATNLVLGDNNGVSDIFVRDLQTGATERVSIASDGTEADGENCCRPSISADGRFVAFSSEATNLVANDVDGERDVFVRDRLLETTELVSIVGHATDRFPAISADGQSVAFEADPHNPSLCGALLVYDRDTAVTDTIDAWSCFISQRGANQASLSADGRFVVYRGSYSLYTSCDTVDMVDREARNWSRIANCNSSEPDITPDGRFIAFKTDLSLVPSDTNGFRDAYIYDRATAAFELISADPAGDPVNTQSCCYAPSVSDDGRFVSFASWATNLVADGLGGGSIFVRDRWADSMERLTRDFLGGQADGTSFSPSISGDGRLVAFSSIASDLVPNDTNGTFDVFVSDRCPAGWCLLPPPLPQNLVIFVQGILTDGGGYGDFLWMQRYLSGLDGGDWVPELLGAVSFCFFEYTALGEDPLGCPTSSVSYGPPDTLWSIDNQYICPDPVCSVTGQAQRLADLVNNYLTANPSHKVTLVGHSQGGVIAAYAARELLGPAASQVRAVVTLDSPLGGVPGVVLDAWVGVDAAESPIVFDSPTDQMNGSDVIRSINAPGTNPVRVFTVDANPGAVFDPVLGLNLGIVADETHSTIATAAAHLNVDTQGHSDVKDGNLTDPQRQQLLRFLVCAVAGLTGQGVGCLDFANAEELVVSPGSVTLTTFNVTTNEQVVRTMTSWPGSIVTTTLVSPSGVRIDAATASYLIKHTESPTFEMFELLDPELGTWTVELYGEDVLAGGEPAIFVTASVPDPDDDQDSDLVHDAVDNCVSVWNESQTDTDGDGTGDECDTDIDDDTVANASDNCPYDANAAQADTDGNGVGDACDPGGVLDSDTDGIVDNLDNCPFDSNADQTNTDGGYLGDACDLDDDNDNCTDMQELSTDETLGGRRDALNPWDFYDVSGFTPGTPDGVIDLAFDILGVIQHYAPTGAAPYDVEFDRGPSSGPNPWNMTAPDGVIDLANDILGVIQQYDHRCT